ncbi:MAG: hypothetical protein JWQ38_3386 [Flavipsychrobacter sp.]|nr:hypothetical protein [Flavipsychrobacter sp.]
MLKILLKISVVLFAAIFSYFLYNKGTIKRIHFNGVIISRNDKGYPCFTKLQLKNYINCSDTEEFEFCYCNNHNFADSLAIGDTLIKIKGQENIIVKGHDKNQVFSYPRNPD